MRNISFICLCWRFFRFSYVVWFHQMVNCLLPKLVHFCVLAFRRMVLCLSSFCKTNAFVYGIWSSHIHHRSVLAPPVRFASRPSNRRSQILNEWWWNLPERAWPHPQRIKKGRFIYYSKSNGGKMDNKWWCVLSITNHGVWTEWSGGEPTSSSSPGDLDLKLISVNKSLITWQFCNLERFGFWAVFMMYKDDLPFHQNLNTVFLLNSSQILFTKITLCFSRV